MIESAFICPFTLLAPETIRLPFEGFDPVLDAFNDALGEVVFETVE
jgi:hypothetical protein